MSREFSNVVRVDHLHLDKLWDIHIIDSVTRYSAITAVEYTVMSKAITSFESEWASCFSYLQTVLFDPVSHNDKFSNYLSSCIVDWRRIPLRRHQKNILESKKKFAIYSSGSLQNLNRTSIPSVVLSRLHSAFQTISLETISCLPQSLQRDKLDLCNPVCSPLASLPTLSPFLKLHWLSWNSIWSSVPSPLRTCRYILMTLWGSSSRTSTKSAVLGQMRSPFSPLMSSPRLWQFPAPKGRTIKAAVEDARLAIVDDELALAVQEAIDELSIHLDTAVDKLVEDPSGQHEGPAALSSE